MLAHDLTAALDTVGTDPAVPLNDGLWCRLNDDARCWGNDARSRRTGGPADGTSRNSTDRSTHGPADDGSRDR